jgi:hypothetical protein
MKHNLLALGGAVAGGVLGYFAFRWILTYGFYALVLPGGLVGIGAGIARNRSVWVAVVCGILALALGVFSEYRAFPFIADDSLGYFLAHLHQLSPVTLLMIGLGAFIGFWIPFRRTEPRSRP